MPTTLGDERATPILNGIGHIQRLVFRIAAATAATDADHMAQSSTGYEGTERTE